MATKYPLRLEKTGRVWRISWVVGNHDIGSRLCWDQEDEEEELYGLRAAVASAREFPDDEGQRNGAESYTADWAARETGVNVDHGGAYWPTRAKAAGALSYIKKRLAALMDGAEPEPWWMGKARAAGWTPPEGQHRTRSAN